MRYSLFILLLILSGCASYGIPEQTDPECVRQADEATGGERGLGQLYTIWRATYNACLSAKGSGLSRATF